jgi:hypothetical protein
MKGPSRCSSRRGHSAQQRSALSQSTITNLRAIDLDPRYGFSCHCTNSVIEASRYLAESVNPQMVNFDSTEQPAWQRNPVFEFFASLKLAVVLLAVIIIAAIAGTIYESSFDAKVARAYVYGAPWFNVWLVLLGANLACSALSRCPWRKHHLAFLITHLGIITLLTGSLIGRIWGIEGTITLFKGDPPTNRLLVDQRQLRVHDVDGIVKGYPAEFLHHPPTPQRPRDLGLLASGAHLQIVDYAPAIEGKLNPKPASDDGAPALHFTIATAMMNQHLDGWLLADDSQHGNFSMGLANIELKRGAAPDSGRGNSPNRPPSESEANPKDQEVDLEESIFAFSKAPDEQIGHVRKGGSTGAKVRLVAPVNGNKGYVVVSSGEKETIFDVAENLGRDVPIETTPFTFRIENYWPDFRIENGKPSSLSDQPNNPAVLVTISGRGVAGAASPDSHGTGKQVTATGGRPTMPAPGEEAPNHLTLFIADDGAITYELVSRKNGKSSGKIDLNKPLLTGWADWQLIVDKTMSSAQPQMDFTQMKSGQTSASSAAASDLPDGVRLRVQQDGETIERWAPAGWQITIPTSPSPTMVAYGWKTVSLPIGLELLDFEVKRNEGSDSPAGFKSTLRIVTADGETATGACWMNNPFSFPGNWWRTWTGLTYKISQASWNPENLGQSTVQILRDPGWLLKWIGSLLVVIGVFMMFYLRPYRKQTEGEPITPKAMRPPEPTMLTVQR